MGSFRRLAAPVLGVAALAVLAAVPAFAAKPARPSTAVVSKLLTTQYTQESKEYSSVKESYTAKSIQYGTPHIGDHWADGTPPNTKTMVFPVKVTAVYWKCYSTGEVDKQKIVGEYGFFKDEFHSWTFRIKNESRTPPPGSDRVNGGCPIK